MNWLDLSITVVAVIGLVKGLFDGFVKQVISFLSLIFAVFLAGRVAQPLRDYLIKFDTVMDIFSPSLLTGTCYVLAFILIIWVLYFFSRLLNKVINLTPAAILNIMLGGLFGLLFSVISLSILFNVLNALDADSDLISKQIKKESVLYEKVEDTVPTFYPFVRNYFDNNKLLEKFPILAPEKEKHEKKKTKAKEEDLGLLFEK